MGNKIITEADVKASPRPVAPKGVTFTAPKGQRVSLERGKHTRSKKKPGKRALSGACQADQALTVPGEVAQNDMRVEFDGPG